ncbi:uncharacterized protein LOC119321682 isoform X1 [Triticum dicoccoides]|uniref:uncharacterized protein LOC119321682 isoform X1 n=1 Tax=Triticum dicoccoides TaxID=85692 RepID=UPI00188FD558|nr:uncharacterized protein LOC119321682 isoform X1 [Triticum dicoccoides]
MEKFQQFFRIMMLVLLEKEFVLKSLNAAHMTAECPIVYYMDMVRVHCRTWGHRFHQGNDRITNSGCQGKKSCEKETTQRRRPLVRKGPVHTDMEVGAECAVYHENHSILCAEERVCRSSASNSNPAWLVGEKVYFLQSILRKQLPINSPEDAEASHVTIEHWREGIIVLLVS